MSHLPKNPLDWELNLFDWKNCFAYLLLPLFTFIPFGQDLKRILFLKNLFILKKSLYWDKLYILNICNLMSLEVSIHLWRDSNICNKYIHHLQIFFQPSLERILLVKYLIHFKSEVDMNQMSNWCSVYLVVNKELEGFMWHENGCVVRDK